MADLTGGAQPDVRTIHPDARRLPRRGSLAVLPLALLGAIRLVVQLGWVGAAILVATVGVGLGLAFLIRRLMAFHSYARLTSSTLTVKPWYGRPRSVPRRTVSQVVLTTVHLGWGSGPDQPRMLFLDGGRRCLLSLNSLGIPAPETSAFARALGVPVDVRPDPTSPKELRRAYPGSVSAYYAHQGAFSVGISVVIIMLVVGGVVAWAGLTGQLGPLRPVALGVTQPKYTTADRSGKPVGYVTVLRVDNPARASIPASALEPGTHFVGIAVRVRSTGHGLIDAPSTETAVIDAKGHRYSVDRIGDPAAAKLNSDRPVGPGAAATAYVLIRVPDPYVVTRVRVDGTGGDLDTLTWIVPPRPAPPTPSPAPLGQTFSLGDQQASVLAVDDPAQGRPSTTSMPEGDRLVGVEIRIGNAGSSDGDPPYQPLSVVDSRGGRDDGVDISASAGAAENPVKAGHTVTTTVYFDVPRGARVVEVDFQYYPTGLSESGGRATVAWAAPPP